MVGHYRQRLNSSWLLKRGSMINPRDQRIELTKAQHLRLKLFGHAYVGHRTRPGWRGALPFYAFNCPEHGIVVDYAHGFKRRLACPICSEEVASLIESPHLEVEAAEIMPEP